jgi:hypothetical protein
MSLTLMLMPPRWGSWQARGWVHVYLVWGSREQKWRHRAAPPAKRCVCPLAQLTVTKGSAQVSIQGHFAFLWVHTDVLRSFFLPARQKCGVSQNDDSSVDCMCMALQIVARTCTRVQHCNASLGHSTEMSLR